MSRSSVLGRGLSAAWAAMFCWALLAASAPSAFATTEGPPRWIAFQTNTNLMWTYLTPKTTGETGALYKWGLGMAYGTSPAMGEAGFIAESNDYYWQTAFQANNADLYVFNYQCQCGTDTGLGMQLGTSPSVEYNVGVGANAAFQANNGLLYIYKTGGSFIDTGFGMDPASSPSIILPEDNSYSANYEVAFQTNTHEMWTYSSVTGVLSKWGLGMAPGTSPDMRWVPGMGTMVAFQANNGDLYVFNATTGVGRDMGFGMAANTSPSIASVWNGTTSGYEVAFHTNTGKVWTYNSIKGLQKTTWGMAVGTSPSVGEDGSGQTKVAFQALGGELDYWSSTAYPHLVKTGFGMDERTNPSVGREEE